MSKDNSTHIKEFFIPIALFIIAVIGVYGMYSTSESMSLPGWDRSSGNSLSGASVAEPPISPTAVFVSPKNKNGAFIAITPKNSYADPQVSANQFCVSKGFLRSFSWVGGSDCSTKQKEYFFFGRSPGIWYRADENECMSEIVCTKNPWGV